MKFCIDCKVSPVEYRAYCRECNHKRTHLYDKTPKGYLVRTYRRMLSRVQGVDKNKRHLYEGLPICGKEEFYLWSMSEVSGYINLLTIYSENNYDLPLAPSIDRIEPDKGYVLSNIRWIHHKDNSSLTKLNKDRSLPVGISHTPRCKKDYYIVSKTFNTKRYVAHCRSLDAAVRTLMGFYEENGMSHLEGYQELVEML